MKWQIAKILLPFCAAIGVLSCSPVVELEDPVQAVSMDPGVLSGELENGFQYYLRSANATLDSDRIEVRLVSKAGSLIERDDQLGYAHLLEHMAFRGTENFSLSDIESLLDGVGLRWGADVNATTHYGATIYRFSLHQNDSELLPELFALMREWLESIEFDPDALEREKRIVEAEWRERYAARGYVLDPVSASAYSGSRYADRPPAGDLGSIRNATVQSLKEFWQANYRPDNTALIITGNKKPWLLEPLIVQAFSGIDKAPALAATEFEVSDGNSGGIPGFLYYADGNSVELHSYRDPAAEFPELSVNFVSAIVLPEENTSNTRDAIADRFQKQLLFNAYTRLVRKRLLSSGKCDAVDLETSLLESGQFIERVKIVLPEADLLHCLSVTFDAVNAVMNSRLTEEEFWSMQRFFDDIVLEIVSRYRNRNASELAENLAEALVKGEKLLSAIDVQRILQRVVENIDRAALNILIDDIAADHRVIYSLRSNKSAPVGEAEMIDAINSHSPLFVNHGPARIVHGQLKADQATLEIPQLPDNDSLVVKVAESVGYHEWRLSNGATAILLEDKQFDHFSVTAIRAGGYVGTDDIDLKAARLLPQFLAINGLDGYASSNLNSIKNRDQLRLEPFVDSLSHGVSGNASVHNLPSLLTLLDGYFKEPLVIQPLSDSYLRQIDASKPGIQWHELFFKPGMRNFNYQSTESFLQAKQKLFGSPANFGFVFVGSLEADVLERELQRLAYGLPTNSVSTGHDELTTTLMVNHNTTSTDLSLFLVCAAYENNAGRHSYWELLTDIVATRLRLAIREQQGMAYDIVDEPIVSVDLLHQIRLSVAPGDIDRVKLLLAEVLDHLATDRIRAGELRRAIKRRDRGHEFRPGDYQSASLLTAKQWLATGEVSLSSVNSVDAAEMNKLAQCMGDSARHVVINSVDSFIAEGTRKFDSGLKNKNSLQKSAGD